MRIFSISEEKKRELVFKLVWIVSTFMLVLGFIVIILFWNA
ncbi:MAG: hypothetical protein QW083_03995 [Methanomassiliicoccales archaeon]